MTDSAEDLRSRMERVVCEHGPWTAMNIHLGGDVHTIAPGGRDDRLRRLVQVAEDIVGRPLAEQRILDLACLEGHYAMHGARAVGIEIREANIAKARFAQEALGLDNLELIRADVRSLSREAHGGFDTVMECHVPSLGSMHDRITLVAIKGVPVQLLSSPGTDASPNPPWPERRRRHIHPSQDPVVQARRRLGRMVPAPLKPALKGLLRGVGLLPRDDTPPFLRNRKGTAQ